MPVVHNRGRKVGEKTIARTIVFPKSWDEHGHPVTIKGGENTPTETLAPGQHKDVTLEQLKHLKDNFHDEIVNVEDITDMQSHFKATPTEPARKGYVAPDEVDKLVAEGVAAELAKRAGEKQPGEGEGTATVETREALILRIEGMDRADLIALIDEQELGIDPKTYKNPDALKAAILKAIDKKAEKAEIQE